MGIRQCSGRTDPFDRRLTLDALLTPGAFLRDGVFFQRVFEATEDTLTGSVDSAEPLAQRTGARRRC